MEFFRYALVMMGVLVLGACAKAPAHLPSRWDSYYARTDRPRAHVVVVPPQGSTVPMAKLIAQYVAENLKKRKISAVVQSQQKFTPAKRSRRQYFILTGVIEDLKTTKQGKPLRVIRWSLSDSQGRLISSYAGGIYGTQQEWDFGAARLLSSIGISTAGPVAEMVLAETKAMVPLDPHRRGLLVEMVTGLSDADAQRLTQDIRKVLRKADMQVTGDPRQATFRLAGMVDVVNQGDGFDKVRIEWQLQTMNRRVLGRAVQENRLPTGEILTAWPRISKQVAQAAGVGIELIFGTRSGSLSRANGQPSGPPPRIVLPGVPGRAPAPPQ